MMKAKLGFTSFTIYLFLSGCASSDIVLRSNLHTDSQVSEKPDLPPNFSPVLNTVTGSDELSGASSIQNLSKISRLPVPGKGWATDYLLYSVTNGSKLKLDYKTLAGGPALALAAAYDGKIWKALDWQYDRINWRSGSYQGEIQAPPEARQIAILFYGLAQATIDAQLVTASVAETISGPTVISVSPNTGSVRPDSSFTLRFSEPMDRQSVEKAFAIKTYNQTTLSVGTVLKSNASSSDPFGTLIWDQSAFNISWNPDDTEVRFTFKNALTLPSDQNPERLPEYQIVFQASSGDRNIRSKAGVIREEKHFKLTSQAEETYRFKVQSDINAPRLEAMEIRTAETGGPINQSDVIKLRFNKPFIHYTRGPVIAGGANGEITQAPAGWGSISPEQAACNYRIEIPPLNTGWQGFNWCQVGGRAVFDSSDPTHRTILLLPAVGMGTQSKGFNTLLQPPYPPPSSQNPIKPGDMISVTVAASVTDPAGNAMPAAASAKALAQ